MAIVLDGNLGITTPAETVQGALTTTGNTILGDSSTDTLNVGNGGLVKDASGNVGIGTSSPGTKLDVSGSIRLSGDFQSAGNPVIYSYSGASVGTVSAGIQLVGSDQSVRFSTGNTERMRIDSSGNVGIGTDPSAFVSTGGGSGSIAISGSLYTTGINLS
jgi:hypothetical protein